MLHENSYPEREQLSLSLENDTIYLEFEKKLLKKEFHQKIKNLSLNSYRIFKIIQISNFY